MLSAAKHESPVTHTDAWINVLKFIIGPRGGLSNILMK